MTSSIQGSSGAAWLPAGEASSVICALGSASCSVRRAGPSRITSPMLSMRTTSSLRTPPQRSCRRGGGAVVNTASMASVLPLAEEPAYSATKAGVLMFTRTCAGMEASHNVRVTAVLPGLIETPLLQKAGDGTREAAWVDTARAFMGAQQPAEVADVVVGFRWPYEVGPDTQPLQDKVDALLGPYASPITEAVADVNEKHRMPLVATQGATTSTGSSCGGSASSSSWKRRSTIRRTP